MAGPSLVELLATIPDPRKPRGRIHPLTAVLSLLPLAVVHLLEGVKAASKAAATRSFAARPFTALPLLFT